MALPSKARHRGISGQLGSANASMLPWPLIITVCVSGSLTVPSVESMPALMESCPTAPLKSAGAFSGRRMTSRLTGSLRRTAERPKNPPGTVNVAGSIANGPARVGNSTVRSSVTR
jgi:hypothetical protein